MAQLGPLTISRRTEEDRPVEGDKAPPQVEERIKRGRERMKQLSVERNECLRFWRGDQYVARHRDGYLVSQGTLLGSDKPRHRVRTTRNVLTDVVASEVAAATQRVPAYEVNPTTTDPEDISAARLSSKVAHYGYDKWRVREALVRAYTYAVVADEGFIWPYFDNTVGTPVDDAGEYMTGEVCLRVLGPNEVYWEPGIDFHESRWYCVEQARSLEEVYSMPGYVGGKLQPDATRSDVLNDSQGRGKVGENLVLVTEYLERPNRVNPKGRRVVLANKKVIAPQGEYPCQDGEGNPVDEPVLHKIQFFTDPDSDRDMGLVRHLLDAVRARNDAVNKIQEWSRHCLMPQMLAPRGSLEESPTDEPGRINYFLPVGGMEPRWREVPNIPQELFQIIEQADQDIATISAQNEIPSQVESGKGIQALIERDESRRYAQVEALSEFHSRLMRHCLYLVQRHYEEPRLLKIKGRFGWEPLNDFRGADLKSQVDVTVLPGSIEPRTRYAVEQRVMQYAQMGWVEPHAAMSAINAGTADKLIESYELHIARANLIIQKIKAGPNVLFETPPRMDPTAPDGWVPGWMPRKFDNVAIQKSVFQDWMMTTDYDSLPQEMQEVANLYYSALEVLETEEAERQAQLQNVMAESQGLENAAKPQLASGEAPKGTPDQPSLEEDQGEY